MNFIKKHIFLFFALTFASSVAQSQDIQWASSLDFQYNQYKEDAWGAKQVIGAPNSQMGKLDPNAFRLKSEKAFGTVVAFFDKPQRVRQIIVVENYFPGRVSDIFLYDEKGIKHPVYKSATQNLSESHRTLCVSLPPTVYQVSKILVNLNSIIHEGLCQIDAIGITTKLTAEDVIDDLRPFGDLNPQQEMSFSNEKERLDQAVNTIYNETKPIISPDGKTLFFVRQNHPDNINGTDDFQDIYYSTLENEQWTTAKNIGKPLNDKYPNGISSVTPDGNSLVLLNRYDRDGAGLSVSTRTGDGWSYPRHMNIESYENNSPYADFFLANGGKYLLSSLYQQSGSGGMDLFVSFSRGPNDWSKPVNLGGIINSEGDDFAPFLAADGTTLYFSSDGHKGIGSSDIYYSKRLDNTWTNWSPPKNLGTAVNTNYWDAYYTVSASGDYAYFVSTKGSMKGTRDIYRISLPKEFQPEPVILLSGRVFDSSNNQPLEASVHWEITSTGQEEGREMSSRETGSYQAVLPRGKNYTIRAKVDGYISISENVDLSEIKEYNEIERNLPMVPIVEGQMLTLKNISFNRGEAILQPSSFPELEMIRDLMLESTTLEIELRGHTDNTGSARLNLTLSEERVVAGKNYLTSHGIDGGRIQIIAFGGTKPVASNANEDTRKLNRRVEIRILKK